MRSSSPGGPSQPPAPGASQCLAPRAISRLRKPLTGASFSLRGRPSGLVETAATKGVLPAAPRPRLPPERTPPRLSVVHLDPPRKRRLPLAPRHHRHDLVLHGPGRRLLDPETAAEFHRRDAVLRRHDQVDGGKPDCQRQLWSRGRSCPPWAMSASCTGCIDRDPDPPTRNAPDGRSRGRRSRPASAAGPAPRGTAPWCRRPPETPRHSRPRTRDATLNPITVTPSYRTY